MKKILSICILNSILCFLTTGQNCNQCKLKFDTLNIIQNQKIISENDLKKSWRITNELCKENYFEYINDDDSVINTLTRTFGNICIKVGGNPGVEYFMKYYHKTQGSAEEERNIELERLFVRFPEIIFNKIGDDKDLLNDLTWGFLNNRLYGPINPYENGYNILLNPKITLNKNNCKEIFFRTNPSLTTKYEKYKFQIDYIIKLASEELDQ